MFKNIKTIGYFVILLLACFGLFLIANKNTIIIGKNTESTSYLTFIYDKIEGQSFWKRQLILVNKSLDSMAEAKAKEKQLNERITKILETNVQKHEISEADKLRKIADELDKVAMNKRVDKLLQQPKELRRKSMMNLSEAELDIMVDKMLDSMIQKKKNDLLKTRERILKHISSRASILTHSSFPA